MLYNDNCLYHYGVKGMKWGVRRYQDYDGTSLVTRSSNGKESKSQKQAKKDASEYMRAKMSYGEGAGTRRKLIYSTVKQRSADPEYKKAFNEALKNQNIGKHSNAAKREHAVKEIKEKTMKTLRGIKNAALGNWQYVGAGLTAGLIAVYGATKIADISQDNSLLNSISRRVTDFMNQSTMESLNFTQRAGEEVMRTTQLANDQAMRLMFYGY